MPMNRATIVCHTIRYVNDNLITPVRNDSWTWYGAVHCKNDTFNSIEGGGSVFNSEPVFPCDSSIWNKVVIVRRYIKGSPA